MNTHELSQATHDTIEHYNKNAEDYREGTRTHDVSQNINALLSYIEGNTPFTLLDFGCGPGRDLKTLAGLGHIAVGLEGAAQVAEMARIDTGCEVWHQNFLNLELPNAFFDGVYANASLFHIPSQKLTQVLQEINQTLKPRGVLFASNPHGHNEESIGSGRYGAYYDIETWRTLVIAAGFVELTHYYRPAHLPRNQQPWLASVWRKNT
ncbi:class I SAM-dependent methyltransferase [Polynucleobacter antarcticus]|uniref:SAM-dependent methyltransferase n=1 Tax=Polynucleobacter antarcticus TaxID=1743162 RepID=A0A6M9PLH7_9BURK|nr:class I SAM-dependent methyltransferase [Polynucleobacter antarcticus]QKM63710.1 SAM-dependent methyltransferase [Polynucleobacter antarcticus]